MVGLVARGNDGVKQVCRTEEGPGLLVQEEVEWVALHLDGYLWQCVHTTTLALDTGEGHGNDAGCPPGGVGCQGNHVGVLQKAKPQHSAEGEHVGCVGKEHSCSECHHAGHHTPLRGGEYTPTGEVGLVPTRTPSPQPLLSQVAVGKGC